ncbi:MAG: PilZ domain-containing protein [Candidatus Omnitrophica bacterium]|nr:PilZ domain-containing protein [Candidatus Omnitrophota bacterium]
MLSEYQDNLNRRKFLRAAFRGIVSLEFPDSGEEGGCLSQDISEKGLCVNFERFVKANTPIGTKFRLTPGAEPMAFEGRIAWASQVPASDRYRLGIEFTSNNEQGQRNIREYVILNQSK